ncbi:MAG: hypothetical protein ACJAXW_003322 [Candidatus Azotimanducaceae bacterium]
MAPSLGVEGLLGLGVLGVLGMLGKPPEGGGGMPPVDGVLGVGMLGAVGYVGKFLDLQPVKASNRATAAMANSREALINGRIPLVPAGKYMFQHFVTINMKIG